MSHGNTLIQWGILGTATIARKNWQAIRLSGNGVVAAVASRDVARARSFIDDCQVRVPFPASPRAYGGYRGLLDDRAIDAVYLPLPTGLRKTWVIEAAEAGKHVVCEKPCAVSLADLREMTAACERHHVQFMDGVMFAHSARMPEIRRLLEDPDLVGELRRMTAHFSFHAPAAFFTENIRSDSALEPLGCLGDLGWYCIQFFLWTLKEQLPERVSGRLLAARRRDGCSQPVPTQFSAELSFNNGPSAGFYVSFETAHQQTMHLSGTKGFLHVDDFVLPWSGSHLSLGVNNARYVTDGCDFNMDQYDRRFEVPEFSNSHPNAQETNLFRNFAHQVLSGKLNPDWPRMALNTQQVLDACQQSAIQGRPLSL